MKLARQAILGLNGVAAAACAVIVLLLVFHVTLDVVMRYVFSAPLKGTIQFVSLYYMTAISFLALGAVEQRDGHIVVEVVANLMPRRAVVVFTAIGAVMSIAVAGGLALRTWGEAQKQLETGAFVMEGGFSLATWPTYFFLPAGFALMAIVAAYKLLCILTGRATEFLDIGFDPGAPMLKVDDEE